MLINNNFIGIPTALVWSFLIGIKYIGHRTAKIVSNRQNAPVVIFKHTLPLVDPIFLSYPSSSRNTELGQEHIV